MATGLTKLDVLQGFAIVASGDNIIVSRVAPSPSVPSEVPTYYMTCKRCKEKLTWMFADESNPAGEYLLDELAGFCKLHIHEEPKTTVQTSIVPPGFIEMANELHKSTELLTGASMSMPAVFMNSEVAAFNDAMEEGLSMKDKSLPDSKYDASDFLLGGELKTYIPGGKTVVSISAEALKWTARLSNFNVDLQCSNGIQSKYRALCGECQAHMQLTRDTVMDISIGKGDKYPEVREFLIQHRHDGSQREVAVGRKFRNVI